MGDGWRSLTLNPLIDQVNTATLRTLAHIQVDLPKFIVSHGAASQRRRRRRQRTG
jgi:hypothetical protein